MKIIKNQRGISLLSMTALAIMVALVALLFIKLFPVYLENGQVRSVLTSLVEQHGNKEMTAREVRGALSSRFNIESIRDISPSDVEIVLDRDGLTLYLDYEVRTALFGNVELLITFQESAGNTDP